MFLNQIKAMAHLVRGFNLLMIAFVQLSVLYFLGDHFLIYSRFYDVFSILLLTVATAAGGYVINDYFDVKIDLINRPNRVIVGQKITRRATLLWYAFFLFVALFFAFMTQSKWIVFCCVFNQLLLWLYANQLKRMAWWGNISVALCTALSLGILYTFVLENSLYLFFYAGMSFGFTWLREIIKDMEDIKGDQRFDCKTLPIQYGISKTKNIAFGILGVWIFFLVFGSLTLNIYLLIYLLVLVVLPMIYLSFLIQRADTPALFHNCSKWSKVMMVLGVSSMIVL